MEGSVSDISYIHKESSVVTEQSAFNFFADNQQYNNLDDINEFEKETSQLWLLRQLRKLLNKANINENVVLDFIFKQVSEYI